METHLEVPNVFIAYPLSNNGKFSRGDSLANIEYVCSDVVPMLVSLDFSCISAHQNERALRGTVGYTDDQLWIAHCSLVRAADIVLMMGGECADKREFLQRAFDARKPIVKSIELLIEHFERDPWTPT